MQRVINRSMLRDYRPRSKCSGFNYETFLSLLFISSHIMRDIHKNTRSTKVAYHRAGFESVEAVLCSIIRFNSDARFPLNESRKIRSKKVASNFEQLELTGSRTIKFLQTLLRYVNSETRDWNERRSRTDLETKTRRRDRKSLQFSPSILHRIRFIESTIDFV